MGFCKRKFLGGGFDNFIEWVFFSGGGLFKGNWLSGRGSLARSKPNIWKIESSSEKKTNLREHKEVSWQDGLE